MSSGSASASSTVGTGYPTSTDLQNQIATAFPSLTLTAGQIAQLPGKIAAAIAEFERRTNRVFQAVSSTYTYDAPQRASGILLLERDLLTLSSLSRGGVALVSGQDYRALPGGYGSDGKPFTQIQFLQGAGYLPGALGWNGVSITGLWGYSATVQDDVFQAMLARASALMLGPLGTSISGGLKSWKDDDVGEDYGTGFKDLIDGWNAEFGSAVSIYARWSPG